MVPWAIYPFAPEDCAALICDRMTFETIVSADGLVEALEAQDLRAECVLPLQDGEMAPGDPVFRIHLGPRTLTVHQDGLSLLLFELLEPQSWVDAMNEVMRRGRESRTPVPVLSDDHLTWR